MPKVTKPAKTVTPEDALGTLEGAGNLDPSALAELDNYLNDTGSKKTSSPKKGKKSEPAPEPDLGGLDDLGGLEGLGGLDDPDTSEIESPIFGHVASSSTGELAGLSARIDSLVEHLSDNHNSLSNRLESLQETMKGIFEYMQVRLDEVLDTVANLQVAAAPEEADEQSVEVDIHDAKQVAEYVGQSAKLIDQIFNKCRNLTNAVDGAKLAAWLKSVGLTDEQVLRFCDLYEIDAASKVTAKFFLP